MKKLLSLVVVAGLFLGLSACGSSESDDKNIVVGASSSPHAVILNYAKAQVEEAGYTLEVVEYDDYPIQNIELDDGQLDANFFQHQPYLTQFNEDQNTDLISAGAIHFEPLGIYSKDATQKNQAFALADVKEGARFAVPDDPANGARALQLLADHGIITLKEGAGLKATKIDVVENPKNVEIVELDAASIPVLLSDFDYAVVNGNYALSGKITDKVIATEDKDSKAAKQFANIIAVRNGDEDSEKIKVLLKALQSDKTRKFIEKEFGDLVVPTF